MTLAPRSWIETKTDEEARALDRGMWDFASRQEDGGTVVSQAPGPSPEDGEFWYDALNKIKDDPDRRYQMASRHLPLPAAWREMAVALRMKIRKARKEKVSYVDLLRELHHLAAMSSYAAYGHIQRVPYSRIASLDLGYHRIGCDRLDLLGVTDKKWMVESWGEVDDHSTAGELYKDMLAADIKRIKDDEEKESRERTDRLFSNLSTVKRDAQPLSSSMVPKRQGLLGWLFGK